MSSASVEPALRAEGVVKSFGGVRAVDGASVAVHPGEIAALIGPNGAGKSTFMRALTGEHKLDAGRVWIHGVEVTGWAPHRISRLGLGRTYQAARLFLSMSAEENLLVSPHTQLGDKVSASMFRRSAVRAEERTNLARAREVLDVVGLSDKSHALAGALSGGQQRLLELGRLLMTQSTVAVLDEPTAGLSPSMVGVLENSLRMLASQGMAILLVEHHMGMVGRMADRVTVMTLGRVIAEGTYEEVRLNDSVRQAYLGV